jgi:hypothetical protein
VGILRDNELQIEDLKKILEKIIVNVFGVENIKIALEINFKGELLIDKLITNDEIPLEIFVHTKHTESARVAKPGIKYNEKNKLKYCEILRSKVRENRILINEKAWTIPEMFSFGMNTSGSYSSQSGHDDVAMTVVNLSSLFETSDFHDLVGEAFDSLDENYKELIETKLEGDKNNESISKEGGFYSSFSKLL